MTRNPSLTWLRSLHPYQIGRRVPLRAVLIIPFLCQIFATVGLVGYLSFRSGRQSVNDLAFQLMTTASENIDQKLENYLKVPHIINQLRFDDFRNGLLSTQNIEALYKHFWAQKEAFESVSYVYMGSVEGGMIAAGRLPDGTLLIGGTDNFKAGDYNIYRADETGEQVELFKVLSDWDAYNYLWFTKPIETGKPTWGTPYKWTGRDVVAISAGRPVYDPQGDLVGTLAVDLSLSDISQFLQTIEISPSSSIFIVENSGELIATSTNTPVALTENESTVRIQAIDSEDKTVQLATEAILKTVPDWQSFTQTSLLNLKINDQKHFVTIVPWQDDVGLNWRIVMMVPETDFMGQINQNVRRTILLCSVALGISVLFGILTARWVVQPILRLNQSAKDLAQGDWNTPIITERNDELGELAVSFKDMAKQLQNSFGMLEEKVQERTKALAVAKDIADKANQAKSDFLANMSHELRTPLNGILGYAQILSRDSTIAPKQKKSLGIIQRCGNHLLTLINDILDLSKIEARKLELLPKSFYLPAFLQSIQELSQVRAMEKGLEVINDFDPHLPEGVLADEKRLGQVLINLLGNAVKFTQTGKIYFRVKRLPVNGSDIGVQRLHFEIEDFGVGISPEDMEKIFLPFEQVGDKQKKHEGTGLGLAISQQIIALMGGQLQATSEVNQGTKFWFDIDIPEVKNISHVASNNDEQGMIVGYKNRLQTVLVVDDRWENRAVLTGLLEPLGFQIIEATNGREALEKIQVQPQIDLLITDLVMPEMNGFDLLKYVRQSADLEKVIAIASSASVFETDQRQSLNAGAHAFLPKPVQTNKLLDLIQKYLQLEWIYGTPTATSLAAHAHKEPSTPPPEDVLKSLSNLVKLGDIDAILEQTTMIQYNYPQSDEFALQVKQLAETCHMDELELLINSHITT